MAIDAYIRACIIGAPELDERTLLLVDSGADPSGLTRRCFTHRLDRLARTCC